MPGEASPSSKRRRRSARTLGGFATAGAPYHRLADACRFERVGFCPRLWSRGEPGVVARVKARVAWSGRGFVTTRVDRKRPAAGGGRVDAGSNPPRARAAGNGHDRSQSDPGASQSSLSAPSVCRAQMACGSDPRPSRVERSGPRLQETRSPIARSLLESVWDDRPLGDRWIGTQENTRSIAR